MTAKFPSAKDAASYVFMMLYSIAKRGDLTQAMIIISTYMLHTSPHPETRIPSHPINPLLAYRATSVSQMLAPELIILDKFSSSALIFAGPANFFFPTWKWVIVTYSEKKQTVTDT